MKRFLLHTLLYLLPLMALLAYFYLFVDMNAMRGDLARLTQKEFHYTRPQPDPNTPRTSCRDVDVDDIGPKAADEWVVFGDSYTAANSRWPDSRWHQFMGGIVGKRIVVAGYFQEPLKEFLSALKHCPDDLGDTVILQSGERLIIYRLCYLDFDNINPPMVTPQQSTKDLWIEDLHDISSRPIEYYKKNLGLDPPPVGRVQLSRPCFSIHPQELLFYQEDLLKPMEWEYDRALENLKRLDSLAQSYGKTIIFVAIPEKYTAYRHQMVSPPDTAKRILESPCIFDSVPRFLNMLPLIDSLVNSGTLDVYLPDDTHFSNPTAKAVGQYVGSYIKNRL